MVYRCIKINHFKVLVKNILEKFLVVEFVATNILSEIREGFQHSIYSRKCNVSI